MTPLTPCPDEGALQDFARGLLDATTAEKVLVHLRDCDGCRGLLGRLRGAVPEAEPVAAAGRTSPAAARTVGLRKEDSDISTLDMEFFLPSPNPEALGRIGTCDVLHLLGRGGMGVVYKAFDTSLHRMVAIKVLSPLLASNPEANRRFLREARAAAGISHPNVVVIHAVGEQGGMPYLVMEFVPGKTLHDRIRAGPPFDVPSILRIGAQIADGLAAAHRQRVVHRDIKPRNIMLEDGIERVKITDFGLALVTVDDSQITSVNRVLGTPAYMSPEQVRGARVDRRSDLFSLGCVLHTMVTGRSPFQGAHALDAARRVTECEAAPLHEQTPPFLSAIVNRLLEKDPADRYQTADELHAELLRHLTHDSQDRSTLSQRVRRARPAPRRRRAGLAAAVAAGVVLLLLAGLFVWRLASAGRGPAGGPATAPADPAPRPVLRIAQSGEADYRTLADALAHAGPGATLRVLDGATYRESLGVSGEAARGLTLEAAAGATLEPPEGRQDAIHVRDASDVTVRGFRMKMGLNQHGVVISGAVSGLVIDGVQFTQPDESQWAAVYVVKAGPGPIRIRNCTFHSSLMGVTVEGASGEPAAGVAVENNRFLGQKTHVFLNQAVRDVFVRGNVFVGGEVGVEVNTEASESRGIRIGNNSFFRTPQWLALKGAGLPSEGVVSNNLVLGADEIKLGDHKADEILGRLAFRNNWWEPGPMTDANLAARFAEVHTMVDLLSRNPNDANFLRPPPNSPLSGAGAGGDEPTYVGAFPPPEAK